VRRRSSLASLLAGLAVMVVAQLAAPFGGPPLYDGVVVQEPYRYLVPGPGQAAGPTSYHASLPVQGTSPRFAAATSETPPQAQLIAPPGAFVVPPGVTSIVVSIDPIPAPTAPADGSIAGNAYRFAVSDPAGTPLAIDPATIPTVILRAPDGATNASVAHSSGGSWQLLTTEATGNPGIVFANVTELGVFAVVIPAAPGLLGLDPGAVAAIAATLVLVVALGFFLVRRRRVAVVVQAPAARRRGGASTRGAASKRERKARRRGGSR
jgi:hypothetical protein